MGLQACHLWDDLSLKIGLTERSYGVIFLSSVTIWVIYGGTLLFATLLIAGPVFSF